MVRRRTRQTLLGLLAFTAALTCRNDDRLAEALGLDMKEWFTPTAENFFSRVGKTDILKPVKEAAGKPLAPAVEKMKKSELATLAERTVKDTGWLPKMLRAPAAKTGKAKKAA